jgi:hypothetical protein
MRSLTFIAMLLKASTSGVIATIPNKKRGVTSSRFVPHPAIIKADYVA